MISASIANQEWLDLASENLSGTVLAARPFRILTLWEMLKFEAAWFHRILRLFQDAGASLGEQKAAVKIVRAILSERSTADSGRLRSLAESSS